MHVCSHHHSKRAQTSVVKTYIKQILICVERGLRHLFGADRRAAPFALNTTTFLPNFSATARASMSATTATTTRLESKFKTFDTD